MQQKTDGKMRGRERKDGEVKDRWSERSTCGGMEVRKTRTRTKRTKVIRFFEAIL